MPGTETSEVLWALVDDLAREVEATGARTGLPYIAVSADIGSSEPMAGRDGRPLAETLFRWVDPDLKYWRDSDFALRAPFVTAARHISEPFAFADGRFFTWRPAAALEAIAVEASAREHGVSGAIIAPAHLPGGAIAAIVWAASEPNPPVASVFEAEAMRMHALATRLMGAYHEARRRGTGRPPEVLTRRETQCLKWAAAGKTDEVIAELMHISTPTIRFHLKNAARKLGVYGRAQTVRMAATLGYVGGDRR